MKEQDFEIFKDFNKINHKKTKVLVTDDPFSQGTKKKKK